MNRHAISLRSALELQTLESREVPSGTPADPMAVPGVGDPLRELPRPRYAVASGPGQQTQVNVYDGPTKGLIGILNPFGRSFTAGATVATGDLNADGIEDIVVSAGPGSAAVVKVFDGKTLNEVKSFFAYLPGFTGGATVAVADINRDGHADVITGAGAGGGPHVEVFSGKELHPRGDVSATVLPTPFKSFFAYAPSFAGGVSVAAGDVNGDGIKDIITGAGPGGGPHVLVFDGSSGAVIQSFFANASTFGGGVSVTVADLNGDGKAEVITGSGAGSMPDVRVYSGVEQIKSYSPWEATNTSGVRVAAKDLDGDGKAELILANGVGSTPRVAVMDPLTAKVLSQMPALTPDYTGGLFVG